MEPTPQTYLTEHGLTALTRAYELTALLSLDEHGALSPAASTSIAFAQFELDAGGARPITSLCDPATLEELLAIEATTPTSAADKLNELARCLRTAMTDTNPWPAANPESTDEPEPTGEPTGEALVDLADLLRYDQAMAYVLRAAETDNIPLDHTLANTFDRDLDHDQANGNR